MQVNYGPYIGYFLWSFALGAVLALVYDLLRFSRRIFKINDFIVNLQDIIFIIISGVGAVCTAYFVNHGDIRLYGLLGILLGFVLYRRVMGTRFVDLACFLYNALLKAMEFVLKLILFPIKLFMRIVGKPIIASVCVGMRKVRGKIARKFVKIPK